MIILVIGDDAPTAPVLGRAMRRRGFTVEAVTSGPEALLRARSPEVALVVLDLDAGDDATALLRSFSERHPNVPVVVLARRAALDDREDLDRYVPDVVTKPLTAEDLITRVQVRLERSRRRCPGVLTSGAIRLELETRRVTVHGRTVRLTDREFGLLLALMRDPGRVVSREQLLSEVWGIDFAARTNVVGVYVAYLRRKLEKTSIQTVRGHGYRMTE